MLGGGRLDLGAFGLAHGESLALMETAFNIQGAEAPNYETIILFFGALAV